MEYVFAAGRSPKTEKYEKFSEILKIDKTGCPEPRKYLKIIILTSQKLEHLLQNGSFFALLFAALLNKLVWKNMKMRMLSCKVREQNARWRVMRAAHLDNHQS